MNRIAIAWLVIASASLAQELPPIREIRGTVLDAASGSPIARATVNLNCGIRPSFSRETQVLTDISGVFRFTNIPSSTDEPTVCVADASRNGYLPPSTVAIGADPVVFKLVPQSVITGTVVDENGQPLPYAAVESFHRVLASGSYTLQSAVAGADDLGHFRIVRLAAGSYRVCVEPPRVLHLALGGMAYQRLCDPELPQDRISLKAGETRDLHFVFSPIPAVRVSGHLSNATPAPIFQLSRETADGLVPVIDDHEWNPASSTFEFPAVIPGKYLLTVQSASPPPATRAGKRIVVGPSELRDLELVLEPPRQLNGVIRSNEDSTLPSGLTVEFVPAAAGSTEYAHADQGGAFNLTPSYTQPYEVRIAPSPWHLQSIKQAGRDITGRLLEPLPDGSWGSIEIVASQSQGSIQGTLRATTGQSYLILLMQERSWGLHLVNASRCDGQYLKFEFDNLPPGEYRILASKIGADIPYFERSYLASRAGFVAVVNVADGQTSRVEVTPVLDDSDPTR